MMKTILEIAVFNIESAISAIAAGADRIEFCENPMEGGTTPSYGSLKTLIHKTKTPVFPIIRPRGGDFLYSDDEFDSMKSDLLLIKDLGYPGAVIGLLKKDGRYIVRNPKIGVKIKELKLHRNSDYGKDTLLPKG